MLLLPLFTGSHRFVAAVCFHIGGLNVLKSRLIGLAMVLHLALLCRVGRTGWTAGRLLGGVGLDPAFLQVFVHSEYDLKRTVFSLALPLVKIWHLLLDFR
jgi:hypothetical protein